MKKAFLKRNKTRIVRLVILLAIFILLCINLTCVFTCVFPTNADGEQSKNEQSQTEERLQENIEKLLGELDLEALQAYVDSLDLWKGESVEARLIEYIKGGAIDYESFGRQIAEVLFKNVREILPSFACITAIALLSGLMSTLKSGTLAATSSDMMFLINYTAALIPLIGVLTECFHGAMSGINSMQKQMQIVYPLLLTLMAASGGTLSVSVCRPAVAFFSTTIVSTISSVVLPLTVTIIAFSMASNLTKELKISKFSAFFKSINKWIIGICISAFGIFFTLQGITAANYDGVVRRAAKYAIGTGIPIVGGFLSGGFDLAVAGSILIKNSLGSMSIFLMLSVLFEPLILLISVNLLLRFTAAITQPFGDSRISDFLGETAENLHYCTAGLLFTAFLYFLTIMQIVSSTEALL